MRHSPNIKRQIVSLRKQGRGIQEIMNLLSLSKTTVWHHIKNVQLTDSQKRKIRSQQGGSVLRKERFLNEARSEAERLLQSDKREAVIALTMLYWAEGNKESCVFTNTDSKMIRLYLNLVRKLFAVSDDRISVTVRTFESMDHQACTQYWSETTGINEKNIHLHQNGLSSRGSSTHGVCRLTIKRGGYTLKVLNQLVEQYCSRSSMDRTRVS